jgi:hypothetical protein
MNGSNKIRIGFIAFLIGIVGLGFVIEKNKDEGQELGMAPAVSTFLAGNPQGTPSSIEAMPNWAEGSRQRVIFTNGKSLLFYIKGNEVVTVYSDQDGSRTEIYRKKVEIVEKPTPAPAPTPANGYSILEATGKHADVLVTNGYDRKTSRSLRESFAFKILKDGGYSSLSLYTSKEAMKADYSASYAERNPQAKLGCIGSIWNDKFIDPVELY